MRTTTSQCRECKKLATATSRNKDGAIINRDFPNGPVIRIQNGLSRIFVHVACRPAFLKRIAELQPMDAATE